MPNNPNIILIVTDQQRYDTIRALGAGWMRTPHLDRLAQEGVALTNCFCTAPSCVPSRASFFNGQYPNTLGVFRNSDPWQDSWVASLAEAGYHCVSIGKMHTVPFDAPCGFHQRFVVENKDRPLHLDEPARAFYDEWDKLLANNGQRKPTRDTYKAEHPQYEQALGAYTWPLEERYHPDVFVGDMALWWVRQRQAQSPLFLQIGFPGPHPPYDPCARHLEMYRDTAIPVPVMTDEERRQQPPLHQQLREEMARGNHDAIGWKLDPSEEELLRLRRHYAANVTLIDEKIGQVLDALAARGYLDNAVVVFTSDHGDCLGDHGLIQKWTMYDCITRVPALVWGPGIVQGGRTIDALTQQMDVADAILEVAGVSRAPVWHAQPVPALLPGDPTAEREFVFAEHPCDNILQAEDHVTMVRDRQWKLVHYRDKPYGELYDLESDPEEKSNLWPRPEQASNKQRLLQALTTWRARCAVAHKLA